MSVLAGAERAVILMAKRPAPGVTKTRLTPELSPEQAAELYECFLLDTIDRLLTRSDCTLVIAIDAVESASYFHAVAPGVKQVVQIGATLGERLDTVMAACLDAGFVQVLALGSDSPDLPACHLDQAFVALDESDTDVVLGPSDDGGYYLIGCKQRWSRLVTDVTMSTPQVLDDTLAIAAELGLSVGLAPEWYDIDEPDDLERLGAASPSLIGRRTAHFLAP